MLGIFIIYAHDSLLQTYYKNLHILSENISLEYIIKMIYNYIDNK